MTKLSGPVTMDTLPAHVPPELVRPYPFHTGELLNENPFHTLIPSLMEGPPAFYTLDGFHHLAPMWVFRRFEDVATLFTDTEHFSSENNTPFSAMDGGGWNLVPAESDPPLHTFHRAIMNPLFSPKRMAALESNVREVAIEAIEAFRERGECEFMADMAYRFPIAVFLGLMGLPMSQVDQFLTWEHGLVRATSYDQMRDATRNVTGFLRDLIEQRRRNPGDDLVSYALTAEHDGKRLNEQELLGFCFTLFIGGLDTVTTNMGWQARHVAEHAAHQAELRADPTKIPQAVEELLRAYAAVTVNRRCIKATQVGGVQLMPGDILALPTPLANNDAETFDRPFEVRLDRNPRHLALATGVHRCLGAPLARRELTIALTEMVARLPQFGVKPGFQVKTHIGPILQVDALPLVWPV
jgi:cytochrome P450